MAVKDKKWRLFFALWPPAPVRESIVKIASPLLHEMSGRVMKPGNLHITLHFIGSVTDEMKDCMHKVAQTVVVEPFDISLDCYGYFSKTKILWMGLQNFPVELIQLHENLADILPACGFHSGQRLYAPHVTLMKKCANPVMTHEDFSIHWTVDEFVLVESTQDETGVNYRIIEKYSML